MDTQPLENRCPRLGNPVPLAYCYQQPEGRPCPRILTCWEWRLPNLRRVLARLIPPEKWESYFETPPEPKVLALLGEIRRAETAHNKEDDPSEGDGNGP
jgi:hypothetical protein